MNQIRMKQPYATSKYHLRGKQIVMKKGMEFPSLKSFLEYSGYSTSKTYTLLEKGVIEM